MLTNYGDSTAKLQYKAPLVPIQGVLAYNDGGGAVRWQKNLSFLASRAFF